MLRRFVWRCSSTDTGHRGISVSAFVLGRDAPSKVSCFLYCGVVMASLCQSLMLEDRGVVSIVGAGGKTTLMFRLAAELSQAGAAVLTTTTTKIRMPSREQSSVVFITSSLGEILAKAKTHLRAGGFHVSAASDRMPTQDKLVGFSPEMIAQLWKAGLFRWILVEADGSAQKPLKAPAGHEPVIVEISDRLVAVVGLDAVGKPLEETWVFRPQIYSEITGVLPGQAVTPESIAASLLHPRGIMKGCPEAAKKFVFLNKADLPGAVEAARMIGNCLLRAGRDRIARVVTGQLLHAPPVLELRDLSSERKRS